MDMLTSKYLIYIVLAVIAVFILGVIIKNVFKILIFVIVLIAGFSLYNTFVNGVSPIEQINSCKMDISYGKDIKEYSIKIENSLENIKKILDDKNINMNSIKLIKAENENIHMYEKEVKVLEHSKGLNSFHNKYCEYLNNITTPLDAIESATDVNKAENIASLENIVQKTKTNLNKLLDSKFNK